MLAIHISDFAETFLLLFSQGHFFWTDKQTDRRQTDGRTGDRQNQIDVKPIIPSG